MQEARSKGRDQSAGDLFFGVWRFFCLVFVFLNSPCPLLRNAEKTRLKMSGRKKIEKNNCLFVCCGKQANARHFCHFFF
jgi:hypothetical protein